MIIELQIKGVTTRLNTDQARALYKELAPLFEEEQNTCSSPWHIMFREESPKPTYTDPDPDTP